MVDGRVCRAGWMRKYFLNRASTANQKATLWGVAMLGGILAPRPGLEPGTSGLTVRGLQNL
jgi:hypothetical protein